VDEDKYGWLFDEMEGRKEKIKFKDRTEYRRSGKKHNLSGPAVMFDEPKDTGDGTDEDEFWIKGEQYTREDWEIMVRPVKLKHLMKKINKK
jgi:hypothetical protein